MSLIKLFVFGVDKHLHTVSGFIFVHHNVDRVAAIAAILNVVLVVAADIQRDMGWVATKWAENGFMKELHRYLLRLAVVCAV
jgi:hypothetical protein